MKAFQIRFIHDAARDLEEIWQFIAANDSPAAANRVLEGIDKAMTGLRSFPHKGNHPKELLSLGIREYRETLFKPYRILYRTVAETVYIYLIADGRRDMQSLLSRRLLGA